MEAKAAVLHFLPIHVDGNEEGYKVEQDGARDHQANRSNIAGKKKGRHICGNFNIGLFCGGDRGKLHFLKFPRSVGPFDPRKLLSYWSIFSKASLIIQSSFNHNSILCIFIDIISTVLGGVAM